LRGRSESLQLGDLSSSSGSSSGGGGGSGSGGNASGHLRLDPNLPISFQFHTYSSLSPASAQSFQSDQLASNGRRRHNHNSTGRAKSASFSVAQRGAYGTPGSSGSGTSGLVQGAGRRGPRNASISEGGCSSPSFASTRHRELHKTLEKNRRAHLRSCFEQLKQELPKSECAERKCSHINIIHLAIKHIEQLQQVQSAQQSELRRLSDQHQHYLHTVRKLNGQLDDTTVSTLDSPYGAEHLYVASAGESLPSDIASVECVVTERKSIGNRIDLDGKSAEHTRQMDQLLLQVQRTLWCGPEASGNSSLIDLMNSSASDSIQSDPSGSTAKSEYVDDDDDIDDEHRLDIDLDDAIEVDDQSGSSQPLIRHQYVDETSTSGELRVVC
jgi:hypothetical protein